ncbi:hypothetical protein [Tessaracoccus sp. OH4464_COT-324]|uniref:hypothetical protein n=1 Tax=Tessaracoccus sp. OH4464_COT-324 TaxID=2491059 RepID=UPI000F63E99B|nr:hypothetical protein [Tessaracoccus sp. OH4464_COT-324]RRD47911.1 hypothetical protein EII42_01300 [Tessaracoccus sp. OH4464_COT-324]
MALFSNLNLNDSTPLRAHPIVGMGPKQVHSTRLKVIVRALTPVVAVALGVGLFLLGRVFYLALTGG